MSKLKPVFQTIAMILILAAVPIGAYLLAGKIGIAVLLLWAFDRFIVKHDDAKLRIMADTQARQGRLISMCIEDIAERKAEERKKEPPASETNG